MKKLLTFNAIFLTIAALGQSPKLQFNHAFVVLDSTDYSALINSQFIKNEFSGFFTRSTSTSSASWTGAYIFGDINYLEIFAPSASEHHIGNSAIALGPDNSGDLQKANDILSKYYKTKVELKERKVNDNLIPWFEALYIIDSSFSSNSDIDFWIMEYKKEYFQFNHWNINGDSVTRKAYLAQHEEKRKGKFLKRFTGITFYGSKTEIQFYSSLLLLCGFTKSSRNSFISLEGFLISFVPKKPNSLYSVRSLQFETSKPSFQKISISDHIQITFQGQKGQIKFN